MRSLAPDALREIGDVTHLEPLAQSEDSTQVGPFNATDAGNAKRFAHQHSRTLRYCPALKRWFAWDERRWKVDDGSEVMRRAKATARSIYVEAGERNDDGERKRIATLAIQTERLQRLEAMIRLAQSEEEVTVGLEEFDDDPMLFNVANGALDLKTGALRPHDPSLMITKLSAVEYDQDAKCPLWLSFLERIFGEALELIPFIQRALGYSLTGCTVEQVLFVLLGTGANGKSTFLEIVRKVLGEYALQTPAETLLAKAGVNGGAASSDLARLDGARFVTAVEPGAGRKLAEAMVKLLTGGDRVTARYLFGEFFEFTPVCKLWLATNHKPGIHGRDDGIWRRIKLIPFAVTIPEHERDNKLLDKLKLELSGILAWMVRGSLDWQSGGLGSPSVVQEATAAYREETDPLADFIAECLEADLKAFVSSKDLHRAYRDWAGPEGADELTSTKLGALFGERPNVKRNRRTGKRGYYGYRLKSTS